MNGLIDKMKEIILNCQHADAFLFENCEKELYSSRVLKRQTLILKITLHETDC